MNCEASERSSDLDRENDNEIREFKREIEERFKLSIANKIYTFPKTIRTISDLISSSESDEEPNEPALRPNGFPQSTNRRNFKKKSKSKLQESPAKELEKSYFTESIKKGKDKLKTSDSTNKRKDEDRKNLEKNPKLDKTALSKKDKKKPEKGKTEHDSAALLETIRSKMGRK